MYEMNWENEIKTKRNGHNKVSEAVRVIVITLEGETPTSNLEVLIWYGEI